MLLVALIGLAVMHSASYASEKSAKATDFFQRGEKAYFKEDFGKAISWYRRAAELGNLDAKRTMALMYATGQGVVVDRERASALYRRILAPLRAAAEKKNINALRTLAYMHRNGLGVPLSGQAALGYYKRAANLGNTNSMHDISEIYDAGALVSQDYQKATEWLVRAAKSGDAKAMQKLGNRYLIGEGVPRNKAQAIKWYQTAADFGDKLAKRQLKLLGKPHSEPLKLYSSSGNKQYTLVRYRGVRVDLSCFNLKENCLALRAVDQIKAKKTELSERTSASPGYQMCSAIGGRRRILRDASRREYYVCSFIDNTMVISRDLINAKPRTRH